MKHISVIVPAGESVLSSIIGSYKIFSKVNEYLIASGNKNAPVFKVDLVGLNEQTSLYNGAFDVNPTVTISDIN